MITIRTMKQIATSRSIPSFRSTGSCSRLQRTAIDQGRRVAGYAHMQDEETRRQWRNQMWQNRSI
jgi:5-formyltetrahydrofolate cyclo-ligase